MTQDNEDKFGDSTHEDQTRASARDHRSQGGPGGFLIGIGVMLWVGAGALMSVPGLVPQYAWVFKQAAKHGITSGPLLLSGLCLCGLGLVARALRARKDDQAESQQRLRFDQLEGSLAFVREGIDAARADFTRVQQATQSLLEIAQAEQANAAAENRQDAIFRLAASLDQVGAHLDQRLQAQQAAIQDTLEELSQSVSAAQTEMRELASSRPTASGPGQLLGRALGMKHPQMHDKRAPTIERSSRGTGMTSGLEGSLGLLDTLDDAGAVHSVDSAARPQSATGEAHRARESAEANHPPAPLPRDGVGQHSDPAWDSRPKSNGMDDSPSFENEGEISTREKIELLRALMDDVRVREALSGLTSVEG